MQTSFRTELSIAVGGLGFFGIYMLQLSTSNTGSPDTRVNAVIAGCVCLGLAATLLIVGVFAYRGRE